MGPSFHLLRLLLGHNYYEVEANRKSGKKIEPYGQYIIIKIISEDRVEYVQPRNN